MIEEGHSMHEVEVKTILTPQNGMNVYRGATDHCLVSPVRARTARVKDPEDVEVKTNAPQLLAYSLKRNRSRGMISVGGLSDPYNPLEEKYRLMRECLRVLDRYDFGVTITTRYSLLLRDLDILSELAHKTKVVVTVPFPALQTEQFRLIEGELGMTDRIRLLDGLTEAGIETVRVVPADEEMQAGLPAALRRESVHQGAGFLFHRLVPVGPHGVAGVDGFRNRHIRSPSCLLMYHKNRQNGRRRKKFSEIQRFFPAASSE